MNFPNPSQRKVLLDQMGHPVMEVVIDKKALSLLFILKIRPRPISPFCPLARCYYRRLRHQSPKPRFIEMSRNRHASCQTWMKWQINYLLPAPVVATHDLRSGVGMRCKTYAKKYVTIGRHSLVCRVTFSPQNKLLGSIHKVRTQKISDFWPLPSPCTCLYWLKRPPQYSLSARTLPPPHSWIFIKMHLKLELYEEKMLG